jgi:hypothetical protein
MGYSLGKVHSGLIAYFCDLYRDGTHEPLESLFGAFGVRVPSNPVPHREWRSLDLAIFDYGDMERPRILIEVKVDDHEGDTSEDNCQTIRYAREWPSCDAYLFITLGMGEYYHRPRCDRFTWVRIREFLRALECVKTPRDIINQWTEEVRREVQLQEAVFRGDRSRLSDYRAGSWNIYFLGHLADGLAPAFRTESIAVDPTCYPHGRRPDTILNFGWEREPQYMEINYNGRLNLKISLDTLKSATEQREAVDLAIQACRMARFEIAPTYHHGGKIGKSKTIASFDLGLANEGGALCYRNSPEETKQALLSILRVFYGRRRSLGRA